MKNSKEIDAYIKAASREAQTHLRKLRALVRKAAPEAEEVMSYRIPTYRLGGNLVHFGAFKDHVSFFPMSSGVKAFKKELSKYHSRKGTIQFPLDRPLPAALITKIVAFRVRENERKVWKTCSRGHKYRGGGGCPVCWPGGSKKGTAPKK